jgi:hypothetical protein
MPKNKMLYSKLRIYIYFFNKVAILTTCLLHSIFNDFGNDETAVVYRGFPPNFQGEFMSVILTYSSLFCKRVFMILEH